MRVLAVENYRLTHLGTVGRVLSERGADIDICKAFEGAALPADHHGHDRLIILGGASNALNDAEYTYFPHLLDLIRGFHEAGKPILGICLGSQLIARAFGGGNILGYGLEFGYQPVTPTEAAKDDPVFSMLTRPQTTFHWHEDTVTLPDGAVHLASSEATPIQAYRMGGTTYAVQFHFETSQEMVHQWSDAFADEVLETIPDWPARRDQEIARFGPDADAFGAALARRWMAL